MAQYKLNPNMFGSSFGSFAGMAPSTMRHIIGLANMKIKEAFDEQLAEMGGQNQRIGMSRSANPQGETAKARHKTSAPRIYPGGGGGGGASLPGAPLKPAGDLTGAPPGQSNIDVNAALQGKSGSNTGIKNYDANAAYQTGKALQMGSPGYAIDFTKRTVTTPTGGTVQKVDNDTFQRVPSGTTPAAVPGTEGIQKEQQKTSPGQVSSTFVGGDPEEEDPFNEDLLNLYLAQQSTGGAVFQQ